MRAIEDLKAFVQKELACTRDMSDRAVTEATRLLMEVEHSTTLRLVAVFFIGLSVGAAFGRFFLR